MFFSPIKFSEETIISAREKASLLISAHFPCQLPIVDALGFLDFSREMLADLQDLPINPKRLDLIARNRFAIAEYEKLLLSTGIINDRTAMQYLDTIEDLVKAWQPILQKFEAEKQQELELVKKDFLLQIPLITKDRVDV